jgi:hypothetical protein
MYLIVGFLTHKILGMLVCKLELKGFFLWQKYLLILRNVICNKNNLNKKDLSTKNHPMTLRLVINPFLV